MASLLAPGLYRCYYCQFESTENSFKYFDNKKVDQPRHQCRQCHKLFTLGSHGRPQGKTYAKKRNEDPAELQSLPRQCRHCGVADNARFKYYNNNNRLQPRFKCLSCGKQFQMRLMGSGEELHLVHTSCNRRHATGRCKKPGVPEAFTKASDCGEESYSYQPLDESFMPERFDPLMALEPGTRLLPEGYEEDGQYASFLEAELTNEKESPNADSISCNASVDDGVLPGLSIEDAECLALLEPEWLTDDSEWAPNVALVSVKMADMDSNCTSDAEVVSGTMLVETLAPAESDSWSNETIEEPSSLNYLEAALACCKSMDMARSMPVAPVQLGESSSSGASLTTSEPYSFQRDLMEEDESSVGDWNEGQEEEDDTETEVGDRQF